MCDFVAALLKVHDGVRDLYVNGLHYSLNIEWTNEPLPDSNEVVQVLVPAVLQLGVVGEAALHHVLTVSRARPDGRQSLAGGAGRHLGQSLHTLVLGADLEDLGQHFLALLQRLGECPCRYETSPQLERQLLGYVSKRLELLHIFTDTFQVPEHEQL